MPAIYRALIVGLSAMSLPSLAAACTVCLCSVSVTTPIGFGNYNPGAISATDVVGQLTLSCTVVSLTSNIAYDVRLSRGASGSYTPRRMNGPGTPGLNYNLYTTAARSTIWGDGTGGSGIVSGSGTVLLIGGLMRTHSVFGRVPPGQYIQPGAYSDVTVVTVTF